MKFNNDHLDDGYEADSRMHAKKDDKLMEDDDQNCYSCGKFANCRITPEYNWLPCVEWKKE